MSRQELNDIYRKTWRMYYTLAHLRTVIARGLYYGLPMAEIRNSFVCTITASRFEDLHPIESGALRVRDRLSRRPGWQVEPPVRHALRCFARNTASVIATAALLIYAYGLELQLRRERARGRLDRYIGEQTLSGAPALVGRPKAVTSVW